MSLTLLFVIGTVVVSIISKLFVQEKSENDKKRVFKRFTKAGLITFSLIVILGGLSIYFSIRDSNRSDTTMAELKRLQYPLPNEIELTFDLYFKLKPEIFQKFTSVITKHDIRFTNPVPGRGYLISNDLLKEVMSWEKFCTAVSIHFSNNYRSGPSVEPIASFTNMDLLSRNYKEYPIDISWNYFPLEKKFLLMFRHLRLELNKDLNMISTNKYGIKSIVDLKGSKLLLSITCMGNMDSIEIETFRINSNELNLLRRRLDTAYNNELFSTTVTEL